MEEYARYALSLVKDNEDSMGFNIYPPYSYDKTQKGPIRVIGRSDSDGSITFSRQDGIAKLVVDGESISFNENLWYRVVETMLSLNLEILNSNNK